MVGFNSAGYGISIIGDDAATYLHSQLTQDVLSLQVGQSSRSLILEPNGHLVSACEVLRRSKDDFVIICDSDASDIVFDRLSKYLIRTKAKVVRLGLLDLMAVGDHNEEMTLGPSIFSTNLVWETSNPSISRQLLGTQDFLALRVLSNWPRFGLEYQAGSLPNLFGDLKSLVSFSKGCYTGQELVERVDSRGAAAPKVIFGVITDCESFEMGAELLAQGKVVGKVNSSVSRPEKMLSELLDRTELNSNVRGAKLGFVTLSRGISPSDVDELLMNEIRYNVKLNDL